MCGVVGYIGENDAVEVLLEGLKNLNIEVMIQRESRSSKMIGSSSVNARED